MTERYVRLQKGVVGGFAGPNVKLVIDAYAEGEACAIVWHNIWATAPRCAVCDRAEFDALLDWLGDLGVWSLPVEDPTGGEDVYGMDTSLWLSDGQRIWHNGAPSGCVHRRSRVQPSEGERERFAAAVERIVAFANERASGGEAAILEAAKLLMTCESERARQLAEDLSGSLSMGLKESAEAGPLRPKPTAEAAGIAGLRWTLRGHAGSVDACAISADGALVASGGEDVAVRVWDARAGTLLWMLGEPQPLAPLPTDPTSIARDAAARTMGPGIDTRALGFSHDGRFLIHVWSEFVTLWNLANSAEWDPGIREQLACVSWIYSEAAEGWAQTCRVNETDGLFRVWFALPGDDIIWADFELEDGCLVELGDTTSGMRHIAFRPDGGSAITVAPPAELSVGAVPESMRERTAGAIPLNAHDRSRGFDNRGLVFSVGNTHGLFGQGDAAYVISMTEFPSTRPTISLDGAIVACSVARDRPVGVTACIGSRAETVWVWDLERLEPVRKLAVKDVTDCAVSADGRVLVTSSGSQFVREADAAGVVQVWDI